MRSRWACSSCCSTSWPALRRRDLLFGLVDNRQILLVAHRRVLEASMRHVRLSRAELWSQLRLAGLGSLDQVQAMVFETTGDVSVVRAGEPLDRAVFDEIRGADQLLPRATG